MNNVFQLELGPCPADEDAVQLRNNEDNSAQMRRQCQAWREQLFRVLQTNRDHRDSGLKLKVKNMDHDFGSYYEVVAQCDDDNEVAIKAAFWLEENMPLAWDDDLKSAW